MNPAPRDSDEESKKLIEEWLKKGNKITLCPPEARTENLEFKHSFYGRKPKKKEE